MTRLAKRDVEALLHDFDDDPVGALTVALRIVLAMPTAAWPELLDAARLPPPDQWTTTDLDTLARTLNELRGLP